MDFTAFDTSKIDEYSKRAKEQWGQTKEYHEFQVKAKNRNEEDEKKIMNNFMHVFVQFGQMKDTDPAGKEAQNQVKKLQDYITEYFYQCTDEMLFGLGTMYSSGGEFNENIDKAGGVGTAAFTTEAIRIYCGK